ncbi:MAG: DUF4397 domain-containing protein [Bacteroidota bacterium]
MKIFSLRNITTLILSLGLALGAMAQTAKVQVIHNCADPAAASVDIYIDTGSDTIKLDDVAFRTATAFTDLPANTSIDIVVALPTSTSITEGIETINIPSLTDGSVNLAIASGVLNLPGSTFAMNPDMVDNNFTLLLAEGREAATDPNKVDVTVVHGSTDAPSVGINERGNALLDSVAYQDISGYVALDTIAYRIDVTAANDPSSIVAPFFLDASGLKGGAGAVLASGFFDPAANGGGSAPAFGLFLVPASGGAFQPLTAVGAARAQIIHNSADPAAATVDIYIDLNVDTLKLDDVPFRGATGFIDIPTEYPLNVVIAGSASTGIDNEVVTTIPVTGADGGSFYIIANGVIDPTAFAANPESISTGFQLVVKGGAREAALDNSKVELAVYHGATDAPAVDVFALGAGEIVDSAAYTDITDYLPLDPASYDLGVRAEGDNPALAVFRADASSLAGGAGIILASGFLTPSANNNGEALGLLLVLPDGTANLLSVVTNIDKEFDAQLKIFPNPASERVAIELTGEQGATVSYKMIDLQGREVLVGEENVAAGSATVELEVAKLARGAHFLIIESAGKRSVRKVILK